MFENDGVCSVGEELKGLAIARSGLDVVDPLDADMRTKLSQVGRLDTVIRHRLPATPPSPLGGPHSQALINSRTASAVGPRTSPNALCISQSALD